MNKNPPAKMIEAACEAMRPYFDVYESWLVPVLAEKAVAAMAPFLSAQDSRNRCEATGRANPNP